MRHWQRLKTMDDYNELIELMLEGQNLALKEIIKLESKVELLTKALEKSEKKYKSLYRLCGLYGSKLDILVKLEILHEFIDTSKPEKASAKIKELK